jgi:hypothetical protein
MALRVWQRFTAAKRTKTEIAAAVLIKPAPVRLKHSRGIIMRVAVAFPVILAFALGASAAGAAGAGPHVIQIEPSSDAAPSAPEGFQAYHGYTYDLSEYRERRDFGKLEDNLRRQFDMVDNAGFSPRVLKFLHSVPIVASETTCNEEGAAWACYGFVVPDNRQASRGLTTWDHDKQQWTNPDMVQLAADSGTGVIMVSSNMTQHAEDPVVLHEFLHAYHAKLMPNGYDNKGILAFYALAKQKADLPKDTYALRNHKEFFAVTASIFLSGKDTVHDPKTRAVLKEKMPDYYKFLVDLFGFDPDAPLVATPVASAN